MAVECTNCGEELIGAVNRCWRCGHEFVSRPGPFEIPPVRRLPIKGPLQESLAAEVIEQSEDTERDDATAAVGRWSRRGSPFAEPPELDDSQSSRGDVPGGAGTQLPEYPRNVGAIGGAVMSITLGFLSFCLAFVFPVGALIVAALGLGMGIWGVYSRRRGAAIFGLLICCVALAIAGFYAAVDLYTYVHGVSPFETLVPASLSDQTMPP